MIDDTGDDECDGVEEWRSGGVVLVDWWMIARVRVIKPK